YTFGGWYNAWCVDESSTSSSPCGENAPCGFDDTHCLTTEIGTTDTWDAEYYAKWILSAPTYEVTFNMNDHGTAPTKQDVVENGKVTKPADPTAIGYEFGGWYKEAGCANAWDFNTDVVTEATVLYAKWTAFAGCAELWPAMSGEAPTAVGDEINMQTGSTGATMTVLAKANKLAYTSAGLQFGSESGVKVNVVLNNEIVVGTRISMTLVAGGEKTRGLFLYDANGNKINAFTCWVDGTNAASNGAEETFTYTVVANDGLAGTNEFQLWRNNTVYLKSLKVSNCGDAIIYHNLTSEVNIAGKGTVTLGASSVREGLTTTATYSDIDEAYEFVNWTISGAGASIADASANPATITMGTEDAVVTLNLQLKPVYYTVTYKDGESSMGTEEVAENGHPTATGISTAKKGYNFLGWSETDGGAVVELNTITITAATNVYAKYAAIPCPTYGTVFSMSITDPEDTEYNENNEFGLEIGATYTGGKAYSGSKSSTKRIGKIDANGEYSFNANGDVTVKVDLDCALQEGDVLSFTSTPSRELKIQKVAGTDLYTTSGKTFTIPAASPLIGEYEFYLMRDNSQSAFKTFSIYRPAVLTGVTLDDAVVAIGGIVTPTMTLAPVADAYVSSQVWSIEGAGEGTIANIDPSTGEVTGVALGSVTVKVVLNGSIENTCTVTVIESYTQLDVTETSEWNFAGAAAASSKKSFPNNTEEFLLANISGVNNTPEFNARALVIKGKYVSNSQLQAQTIRFNVATSGKLTIRYACTSDKGDGNDRELYINGVATGSMTSNGEVTYTQVVPGGEVTIKALYDKESVLTEDIMNYKYIKFDVNPDVSDADYIRPTTEGRYGTICLPNGGVMVGADLFEVAYYGATSQKIFFDQIMNGEMEAGIPYIFLPKEGVSQLGVYYTDAADATAGNRNGLYGSYTTEVLTRNDGNYVLYNNQYLYVGDESTNVKVGANRAYIKLAEITPIEPALAPGRRRVSMGVIGAPQVTTGVGELNADETPIKVMIDGQLYIIRGEKMYDATGRLVK
ncbi:MAG: InlB B-repeat-containing protein, partial [Paludibacteraceae bacterium]|nr:InlB B-repeat-containing protein [Paludibacteraceae bacterium]